MRLLKRILISIIVLVLLLALGAWFSLTYVFIRPAQFEPTVEVEDTALLRWDEHDDIYGSVEFPVKLRIQSGKGELLYVGAQHTSSAEDPQLKEIEKLWAEFKPTIALCEGRERVFRFASRPEKGKLSESQLVRILAYGHGIPLFTLEPSYDAEVAVLLKKFEPKLVATYLTLRVYTGEAKGYEGDKNALALHLLEKRTDAEGLRGSLRSVEDLDRFWKEKFAGEPDWRTLPDTESVPLLREVGDESREARGKHMIRTLTELVNRGERVFAVVGASHVIRQEPALKKSLGTLGEE